MSGAQTMTRRAPIDVQTLLNESRFGAFQWSIAVLCFLIVLLDGFDTAAIGYIAPSLIGEWGVTRPMLAPVLSAALAGLALGALISGPMADRMGRKKLLVASVALFAVASLASAIAGNVVTLSALRFVTGIGLGAAMPNAITLTSEFCPERSRSTVTNAMICGFPLGAALGGFVAAWMIPQWGWRSVLLAGGIAPLVLTVLLIVLLPESVRYLVASGQPVERIRAVLSRIAAQASEAGSFILTETRPTVAGKSGLALVLSPAYRFGSVCLWTAYFMGLVIFYSLINWMPVLFKDAGIAPKEASMIAALFPLGGVGAVGFGWLMDRFNPNRIVAVGFGLTAVAIFCLGRSTGSIGMLVVVVLVAGLVMNTSQASLPALAAAFYPTEGRATGVAWMLGIGRIGGIAGSFLVAELARRQVALADIFAVIAVAGLLALAALLAKQFLHPDPPGAARGGGPGMH